jgi:hypothetical protein
VPPLPAIVAIVRSQDWLAWRVADSSFEGLGLWINLEGWGDVPLHHVAVEPAVGAHDDPDAAHREVTPLRSGADRRGVWSSRREPAPRPCAGCSGRPLPDIIK